MGTFTGTSVYFDGNDLNSVQDVLIYNHEFNILPVRNLQTHKIARADRSVLTSAEYVEKDALVHGLIKQCTRQEAEAALSELRSLLRRPNRKLRVDQYDTTVEYTATLEDFSGQSWVGNNLQFTMLFYCSSPLATEVGETTIPAQSVTSPTFTFNLDVEGSFTAGPFFTVTVNTVTGATNQSITIKNGKTGQGVTVTRTWSNGDVLKIDSENFEAYVNNQEVDFSGTFPIFNPGTQSIEYVDTFTTRDVDISGTYNKKFI